MEEEGKEEGGMEEEGMEEWRREEWRREEGFPYFENRFSSFRNCKCSIPL